MAATAEQLLSLLEDTANLLKKTQVNLKKCSKARLTKGYLLTRMKCIEEYWKLFTSTHQELVKVITQVQRADTAYFVNDEFSTFEDLYICIKADIHDMILQMESSNASSQQASDQNENTMSSDSCLSQVKLPRIQLPTYKGSYEEWPTFQDLFISLVHNNTSLSDVQKLHYLKTSIAGEPEALLRHVHVTNANYAQAWDTLKKRYGNKRIIVSTIMKRLFSQKKMSVQSAHNIKMLLDTTTECINTLNNLNIKTESWDPVIIFLLTQKLDQDSHKEWENYSYKQNTDDLPLWSELKTFLESKFRTLELVTPTVSTTISEKTREKHLRERTFHTVTPSEKTCLLCSENHTLCHCKQFSKMSITERNNYVRNKNLCYNCLLAGHPVKSCRLPMSCRICNKRHHSLLHETKTEEAGAHTSVAQIQPQVPIQTNVEDCEFQVNTMMTSHFNTNTSQGFALLATAMVKIRSYNGNTIVLRALIDPGSQASFISERATQMLKLKRKQVRGTITGVGSTQTQINSEVRLQILSTYDTKFCLCIEAYVISKQLTTKLPTKSMNAVDWPHLRDIQLADHLYHKSAPIDLLLGVKEYSAILQPGVIKGPAGTPCAQQTALGWILFGNIEDRESTTPTILVMHHQIDLDNMLKNMWELDNDKERKLTQEERLCEEIYKKTHTRNKEGQYIVNLPFKTDKQRTPDGNSKDIALGRFLQLERRFQRNPKLKEDYTNIIEEYLDLKDAEEVPENEVDNKAVYLSHHAIIKDDSESTPIRVVFDASCKDKNGISLNDELLVGPVLQEDLRSIIMRWRMHSICFVADLKKMYRMVLVAKKHIDYQRILWRRDTSENIKSYRLLTVTFGTAPAPYLAVKTLMQLAEDEAADCPLASEIIKHDIYVDDLLTGFDNVQNAIEASKQLKEILRRGGFELQKWSSNSADFMKTIEPENRSKRVHLNIAIDGMIKALGVHWNLANDQFNYNLNLTPIPEIITKRIILSDVQKLFDPLGWIAPCLITAKILIQKLWLRKLNWDEELDISLKQEWVKIREDYDNIKDITVDRWIGSKNKNRNEIELHGFCDASEKAYAAVVYCRIIHEDKTISTKILAARTRVAPVKCVSLPRLELCGAVLLCKLLKQVALAMRINSTKVFAWTDSTIVLSWLFGNPLRWKQFVANRVVEILDNVDKEHWHHVISEHNPADVASRGAQASELKTCALWWEGPEWLKNSKINYTIPNGISTNLEMKTLQVNLKVSEEQIVNFEDYNNLNELLTVIVYSIRFIRSKINPNQIDKKISTEEFNEALHRCLKIAQKEFQEEIDDLKKNKNISKNSKLKMLNPYLDSDGLLRVGGRLRNSNLPEHTKYPIILGNKSNLTHLIIADAHKKTLHGGTQLVLTYLKSKYWIIHAKNNVKAHLHKCIISARHKALTKTQLMGDLPRARTTPARPFLHSGVDFAGPLKVLNSRGRGAKQSKAYISIFICMATKAIHLELVGDLTTASFIGAFRRFVARRGKCTHIWSDQGRNFVGANKELAEMFKEAKLELPGHLEELFATEDTQWHHIPAYSPNFGGLWEAGVKSTKYHLRRILTASLTFEEMTTTLCDIEACLNSRPLIPVDTTDPDAVETLTPGHFLIGEALVGIPSPDLRDISMNRLDRWQLTQKLVRDFWHRWQSEYLTRLQTRSKWLQRKAEYNVGDIVLLKDELLPPGKWSLGRVTAKHPGQDGCTRVYSVKCRGEIVKRSVGKLCDFPVNDNND